jgi:hypothetical protein
LARKARIPAAAFWPSITPRVRGSPSGTWISEAFSVVSRLACWSGNSPTSTPWAALAAAASGEAPGSATSFSW